MAPEYDRYLFSTGHGIDSHLIQKAYSEWSSYCYAAFTVCATVADESAPGTPTSSLGSQHSINLANNNSTHVTHAHPANDIVAKQPTQTHHSSYRHPDGKFNDDLGIPLDDDTCNVQCSNVRCEYCCPDLGVDDMPRQQGYEFGSRLSWRSEMIQSPADTGRPTRGRPVLGVSGLKCQNNTNLPTKNMPKRVTETFPKCATSALMKSRGVAMGCHNSSSATVHCGRFNGDLTEFYQNVRSLETVSVQRTRIVSSRPISDVIEECSSSEEDSLSEDDIEALRERPRRVSFADEHGELLVRTRVFEREDSPITFLEDSNIDPGPDDPGSEDPASEEDADEEEEDDDLCDTGFKRNSFRVMADISYKVINRDIDNVKKLIHKHRTFFDSIKPSSFCDNNDRDSDNSKDSGRKDTGSKSGCDKFSFSLDSSQIMRKDLGYDKDSADPNCNFLNFDQPKLVNGQICNIGVQLTDLKLDSQRGLVGCISTRATGDNTKVFVRCTSNNWQSCDDIPAHSAKSDESWSCDLGEFKFGINLDSNLSTQIFEFAICYRTLDNRSEFWDNNGGKNYKVELCW